jgi:hypothetical protein
MVPKERSQRTANDSGIQTSEKLVVLASLKNDGVRQWEG